MTKADTPTDDPVYDDSGVSDITSSSGRSTGGRGGGRGQDHMTSHMTLEDPTLEDPTQSPEDVSSSEKWALVSLTINLMLNM